jgi:hypothetical protein
MNRRNNWEQLLAYANEELNPKGYAINLIHFEEDGTYNCEILKDGVSIEVYAECMYEDELADLVNEVWHYVATKKVDKGYSDKAKYMVAEQIVGMLENNVLDDCGMESFIGWLEDGYVFFNADCYTDEEIDEAMKLAREIAPTVDELSWKLNVKPGE